MITTLFSIQPIEAPMPAFDKDKLIMAKIDGVGAKVNVSITVFIDNNLTCNGLVRKSEFWYIRFDIVTL